MKGFDKYVEKHVSKPEPEKVKIYSAEELAKEFFKILEKNQKQQ